MHRRAGGESLVRSTVSHRNRLWHQRVAGVPVADRIVAPPRRARSARTLDQITASLTSLSPVATLAIGISIGTWDGTVCSASLSNDNARVSDQLTGNTSVTGSYCIRVYDVGNITATEQVAVTVTHP